MHRLSVREECADELEHAATYWAQYGTSSLKALFHITILTTMCAVKSCLLENHGDL